MLKNNKKCLDLFLGQFWGPKNPIWKKNKKMGQTVPLILTQKIFLLFFSKNIRFVHYFGTKFTQIG